MLRPMCAAIAIATLALAAGCTEIDDPVAKVAADVSDNKAIDTLDDPSCDAPKVLICHIPPGNPGNAHALCIAQNAVQTHLAQHGDRVGRCQAAAPPPPPPPPPACQPFAGACAADPQCCSGRCGEDGTCVDRV